jgi:hypothetical protein
MRPPVVESQSALACETSAGRRRHPHVACSLPSVSEVPSGSRRQPAVSSVRPLKRWNEAPLRGCRWSGLGVRSGIGLCDRPVERVPIRQGGVALAMLAPRLAVTVARAGASCGALVWTPEAEVWNRWPRRRRCRSLLRQVAAAGARSKKKFSWLSSARSRLLCCRGAETESVSHGRRCLAGFCLMHRAARSRP